MDTAWTSLRSIFTPRTRVSDMVDARFMRNPAVFSILARSMLGFRSAQSGAGERHERPEPQSRPWRLNAFPSLRSRPRADRRPGSRFPAVSACSDSKQDDEATDNLFWD